jgi:phage shock protein PspC (stress-responsive transcriptional regulator)
MDATTGRRECPYCAEEIAATARRCPYCRSRLVAFDGDAWRRDHPERRVAGVASAVAHALALPVGAVRLGFVVLTFLHLAGPLLYGIGVLAIPAHAGGPSLAERGLAEATATLRRWRGIEPTPRAPFPGGPAA